MELINRFKKYYNIQLFIGNKLKISKFAKIFELLFNFIIHIYFFVTKYISLFLPYLFAFVSNFIYAYEIFFEKLH